MKGVANVVINTKEQHEIERELIELRAKQLRALEADKVLDAALTTMRKASKEYESKFDEQVQEKKESFEKEKFSSQWDPKLTDALEILRSPLQTYGENCEEVVVQMLKTIENEIPKGASDQKILSCVYAALSILEDAKTRSINLDTISKTLKYQPTFYGRDAKKRLYLIMNKPSSGSATISSQIETKEEQLRRIEKADKYGIAVSNLDTHEAYLKAVKNYEKAQTGDELRASAKELIALGDYLTVADLLKECNKKIKAIEKAEKAEKDAKKALSDSENELKEAEQERTTSEKALRKAEEELSLIVSGMEGSKSAVIAEYEKRRDENANLILKLQNELSELERQNVDAETALGKTFFLAFGKKKELSSLIETLKRQIAEKRIEVEKAQKKSQDYLIEHNKKIKGIDENHANSVKAVEDATYKFNAAKKRLEKAIETRESAQVVYEEASKKLASAVEMHKQESLSIKAEVRNRKRAEEAVEISEEKRKSEEEAQRVDESAATKIIPPVVTFNPSRVASPPSTKTGVNQPIASTEVAQPATKHPYVADAKLAERLNRAFDKLEKLFPEGKVFSFDSIDSELRERMAKLYKEAGYATIDEMLKAYGFEIISGDAVKQLRSCVLYTPGNEPDIIKNKVNSLISRLNEYYPDKVIPRGFQKDHSRLSKAVSGLYQWLGYESTAEMLKAYGFDVQYGDGTRGRPTKNDYQSLIHTLQERYRDVEKVKAIGLLMHDNPDLAGQIKSLNNQSNALFGMSLSKYFKEIGILGVSAIEKAPARVEKKKAYHYLIVDVEGVDVPVFCATDTRKVHEGDFIEMCPIKGNEKMMGRVTETCYYTSEEDLPMPVEEMQQFIRKMLKSELKEIEASKVKYLYCSIRFEGRSDTLYYISPFDDIAVGDLVIAHHNWYGMATGVVTKIEWVSEKTAPYSVKKTKLIDKIVRRASEELEKAKISISDLASKTGTEDFEPSSVTINVTELYEKTTYFASAVFRGLNLDVRNALAMLYPYEINHSPHETWLSDSVSQFECSNLLVPQILENFPNLKAIFFAENWKEGNVYLAYSESGYSTVTDMRLVGKCDFYCRDRWTLIHDPSENSFSVHNVKYSFDEKDKWERFDYVLPDGDKKLVAKTTIASKPYPKKTTKDPYSIINIQYPTNEIFYVAPQKPQIQTADGVATTSSKLAGKTFVVTGDLVNYESRDELKAIIEQSGGKLTGSVSSKTTVLITNYPNSGTTKIQKARELGIEIIDENEFIRRFMSEDN